MRISQHDKAVAYLEKLSNSLFFEIDLSLNMPLSLVEKDALRWDRGPFPQTIEPDLMYPRFEYEKEPMSLYWYLREVQEECPCYNFWHTIK